LRRRLGLSTAQFGNATLGGGAGRRRDLGEVGDHGSCSGLAEGLGFAGLVRVADDGDAAEQAREDVGYGVADEQTVLWLGLEAADRARWKAALAEARRKAEEAADVSATVRAA
jgi:hypothetical protein